jgi:hypothetical protein
MHPNRPASETDEEVDGARQPKNGEEEGKKNMAAPGKLPAVNRRYP